MLNIFCHLKSYQKRLVVERKTVMQLNIWQQIGFFISWVFVSPDVGMARLWSEKNSIVFESVFGLQLILNHFWTVTPFIINVLLFGVSMPSAVLVDWLASAHFALWNKINGECGCNGIIDFHIRFVNNAPSKFYIWSLNIFSALQYDTGKCAWLTKQPTVSN